MPRADWNAGRFFKATGCCVGFVLFEPGNATCGLKCRTVFQGIRTLCWAVLFFWLCNRPVHCKHAGFVREYTSLPQIVMSLLAQSGSCKYERESIWAVNVNAALGAEAVRQQSCTSRRMQVRALSTCRRPIVSHCLLPLNFNTVFLT